MVYGVIAGLILFVILLIAFNVRSNGWRNRREEQRRKVQDRRVGGNGRRKRNTLEHESSLPDRRRAVDRRVGPVTRRRKKRRAEDHLGRS